MGKKITELHYIGLIQDLIDNDLSTAIYGEQDKVSGFKIADVEKAFLASKTLDEVKKYITDNLPSGKEGRSYTKTNLNSLFNYWKGWLWKKGSYFFSFGA